MKVCTYKVGPPCYYDMEAPLSLFDDCEGCDYFKDEQTPDIPPSAELDGYNPLSLLEDVVQIAKYFAWQDEVGDKRAVDIICEIHNGKYGSQEGIWPQVDKALFKLKGL